MLLSAVSVLVVAQSNSEIPEGLMNNPVYLSINAFSKPERTESVSDVKTIRSKIFRVIVVVCYITRNA